MIVGFALARSIDSRMAETIARLARRAVFQMPADRPSTLQEDIERLAHRSAHRLAVVVSIAVAVAYVVAYWPDWWPRAVPDTVMAPVATYVAGRLIGRMVAYGTLGSRLGPAGVKLEPQPGHPDGAAGLKPLGDFYFFQAALLAIAAGFLAAWSLLIPVWPGYEHWREPYLGLLALSLAFEMAVFIWPMWAIHKKMQSRKLEFLEVPGEVFGGQPGELTQLTPVLREPTILLSPSPGAQ